MPTILDFLLFLVFAVGIGVSFWGIADLVRDSRKRKKEREQFEPCERCGKPVRVGAEEYHRAHCLGRPKELRVETRRKKS